MKIGIADPQARVRFSLRILLEQQDGWRVIWEAADCQELFDRLHAGPMDLLLIDCDFSDLPAENMLQLLRQQFPALIILAMSGRQELRLPALQSGADAFACKAESPLKLLSQIHDLFTRADGNKIGQQNETNNVTGKCC